jgi:hypothetical protein
VLAPRFNPEPHIPNTARGRFARFLDRNQSTRFGSTLYSRHERMC